jgi:peptide deformylase
MFVMRGPLKERIYCVNPKIKWESVDKANINEGCLSAPGEFLKLNRSNTVILKYQDEKGVSRERFFTEVHAVCVKHETDHLLGQSFLENASLDKKIRKQLAKKWGVG